MRLLALVPAILLTGCASLPQNESGRTPDIGKMVSVANEHGPLGQVCPISPVAALTAGHIAGFNVPPLFTGEWRRLGIPLLAAIEGSPSHLHEFAFDKYRDLSIVCVRQGKKFTDFYPISERMPIPGDRIYLRGFDVPSGFTATYLEAVVINVDMGYIFFDRAGEGGSSGSCLLNEEDEIVGINVHGYQYNYMKPEIGGATLTVGAFGPDRFPEDLCNE
jgi:hypothetical protein